jgi:uncharacterized membrane protein
MKTGQPERANQAGRDLANSADKALAGQAGATDTASSADKALAVRAEALYLLNLLLAPGVAFLLLLWLAHRHGRGATPLLRCHLRQTIRASLWAGVLLTLVTLLIMLLGGFTSPHTWVLLILYFISCHTMLILFGMFGLARALAGQIYVYPLIGCKKW